MLKITAHQSYLLSFMGSLGVIFCITYFWLTGLYPCPMCLLQQLTFLLLTLFSLTALLHKPKSTGIRIYHFILGLLAFLGGLVAFRQIWMQLDSQQYIGTCHTVVTNVLNHLPVPHFIQTLFMSAPDCAQANWELFGLSMASYSLAIFTLFCLLNFTQFIFDNATHDKD